jgi:hypothetical protein
VQRLAKKEDFSEQGSKYAFRFTLGNKKFEGKEGTTSVTVAVQPIK